MLAKQALSRIVSLGLSILPDSGYRLFGKYHHLILLLTSLAFDNLQSTLSFYDSNSTYEFHALCFSGLGLSLELWLGPRPLIFSSFCSPSVAIHGTVKYRKRHMAADELNLAQAVFKLPLEWSFCCHGCPNQRDGWRVSGLQLFVWSFNLRKPILLKCSCCRKWITKLSLLL